MGHALVLVFSAILTTMALPQADADAPPLEPSGPRDLGTLGGAGSYAVAIDGSIAVGTASTATANRDKAFAYDLSAPNATMLNLGTLASGRQSQAADVSGHVVVGSSDYSNLGHHAFYYDLDNPGMVDMGTLGDEPSEGVAIDGSIIVGWSSTPDGGPAEAFYWDLAADSPAMTPIASVDSQAADVSAGVIVGKAGTGANGQSHAFYYDIHAANPSLVDISPTPSTYSEARRIDDGVVTGFYIGDTSTGAFAYDIDAANPTIVDPGTFGGTGNEINDVSHGVIVGGAADGDGIAHAFAYDIRAAVPHLIDLGFLGEGASAQAIDGDIVTGIWFDADFRQHAFVYDLGNPDAGMTDLGTLGGHIGVPFAVSGHLVAGYSSTAGDLAAHATVWPMPTTTALDTSTNPSVTGAQVTFSASISPQPDGGVVAFTDGASDIAGCTASPVDAAGTATCTTTLTGVGNHSIGATYLGTLDFGSSSAPGLTETVDYAVRLLYDPTAKSKAGATVSLKLMLVNAVGLNLSAAATTLTVTGVAPSPTPGVAPAGTFSYSVVKKTGQYQFSFKTTKYPAGSYALTFNATGDPVSHSLPFVIK